MLRARRRLFLCPLECREVPAVVSNINDSGAGSFRQAIIDTNASGTDNIITFDTSGVFSSAQTISLTAVLPAISDNLAITGTGTSLLTINRGAGAASFRLLSVVAAASKTVSISDLTLTGGSLVSAGQFDSGGALLIGKNQSVNLTSVKLSGNSSDSEGGAIGVAQSGALTLTNCTISGNTAKGTSAKSVALGSGGAIYFAYDGSLTMVGSTISGNSAKTKGGGLYLYASNTGNWTIRNSTLSANTSARGGAISLATDASGINTTTITNTTIVLNSATTAGGGIFAAGAKSPISMESTILSGNISASGTDASTAASSTFSSKNNAIGSKTGITAFSDLGGNKIGLALNLGPLANNGGTTLTHLPGAGSAAIDAGSNPASLGTDQRGSGFVRVFNNTADIGAIETQPVGLPTASGTFANVLTTGGTSYDLKVTFTDNSAIKVSTLTTGNVTISGPSGFTATPTFVTVDINSDGKPRTATYTFAPPGGTWDAADVGSYSISIAGNQVSDDVGNFVPAGAVGSFSVVLPRTLVVTNTKDSGAGSLRQAVLDANQLSPSLDTITFSSAFNSAQTITLTTGQLSISDSVVINGPGSTLLTVNANTASRHFLIAGPGTLNVSITGMKLINGRQSGNSVTDRGGSIQIDDESVTLNGMEISNNAVQQVRGGAISIQGPGTLLIQKSTVSNNQVQTLFSGGAISSDAAGHSIIIEDSTVSGNQAAELGGALYSVGGSVTIRRSTISGNSTQSTSYGGGIVIGNGAVSGSLLIEDSTIDGNFASNPTAQGGGIVVIGATPGVTIRNSTISGNLCGGTAGAGILFGALTGPVVIENCTITNNTAQAASGVAIGSQSGAGTVTLRSTIVANNGGDPSQPDVAGTFFVFNSLIGNGDGGLYDPSSANNLIGDGATPIDPMLGTLQNNGGSTRTHALAVGSPAIDAGANPSALANDQRGPGFARTTGLGTDIGAFEVQPPPTVGSVVVDNGSAQRSMVRSITVNFSTAVAVGFGTPENAFQLTKLGVGGGDVALSVALSGGTGPTTAKLTFSGPFTSGGSLIDGNYQLKIFSAEVADGQSVSLDGDNNGSAGGDFQLTSGTLYRLFGDANGDRKVDAIDFGLFRSAFNSTGPNPPYNFAFDFNNDGKVDAVDFGAFRTRFNTTLSP